MPGHYSQMQGDSAENDFFALARAIGYGVVRWRNPEPGIDFIAEFSGNTIESCTQLRPSFSPEGLTAFSIKSGDSRPADVDKLLEYVGLSQASADATLRQIKGGVLVVGTAKTKDQINDMLSQGVFCWDIRRLIFYAMKAKTLGRLADTGRVDELPLGNAIKGGFVFAPINSSRTEMKAEAHVFVDDHELVIQGDHFAKILDHIYVTSVRPLVQATDVQLRLFLHALGPIQRQVVEQTYQDNSQTHHGLSFPAENGLEIRSYAVSPWTGIFSTE